MREAFIKEGVERLVEQTLTAFSNHHRETVIRNLGILKGAIRECEQTKANREQIEKVIMKKSRDLRKQEVGDRMGVIVAALDPEATKVLLELSRLWQYFKFAFENNNVEMENLCWESLLNWEQSDWRERENRLTTRSQLERARQMGLKSDRKTQDDKDIEGEEWKRQ